MNVQREHMNSSISKTESWSQSLWRSAKFSYFKVSTIALLEARSSIRLVRFWTLAITLISLSIGGYLLSCSMASYVAPHSPTMGITAPLYVLGDIDPTYFLIVQFGALFLLFDYRHRMERHRIAEVLDARPVSNLEYVLGRTFGIAFLLWITVCGIVAVMQLCGFVSVVSGFDYLKTFQIHSVLSLVLVDVTVLLLAWCSLTIFLSTVVRSRLWVICIAVSLMLAWLIITGNAPFSFLHILSPLSNATVLVSDIDPELATWHTIGIRSATVFGSLALIVASGLFSSRIDDVPHLRKVALASLALVLCGVFAVYSTVANMQYFDQVTKWRDIHAEYAWHGKFDVQSITGHVRINPKEDLEIAISTRLLVIDPATEKLVFTFNPAMTIRNLTLNGLSTPFIFRNGLLEVSLSEATDGRSSHTLWVKAHGRPDPRFGYFASRINFITNGRLPSRAVKLFGKDAAIYNTSYVALMPESYWYPVPGPVHGGYGAEQWATDFFDVDLLVSLTPKNWMLVGTGTTVQTLEDGVIHRVKPANSLHEIGLFASEFEQWSVRVDGTSFELYLHQRHSRNMSKFEGIRDDLLLHIQDRLQRLTDLGLTLPHKELSLVEVPSRLRTIGGGWRMDSASSLPGIVLIKEYGFPTTQFNFPLNRLKSYMNEQQFQIARVNVLSRHFQSGLGTDNPWTNLPELIWSHATSARGEHSAVLDQVILALISNLGEVPAALFNVYATIEIADFTHVNEHLAGMGFSIGTYDSSYGRPIYQLRNMEVIHGRRNSVWNLAQRTGLTEIPSSEGHQNDLELLLFKSSLIAQGLLAVNEEDDVFHWLSDLREKHFGASYTYQELIAAAKVQGVVVEPFLTDWLETTRLPGFVASFENTRRIADDEFGSNLYQATIEIRNTQPIAGVVQLRYPQSTTWQSFSEFAVTRGVIVPGNSAKRLNPIVSYPLESAIVLPHLSLNREYFVTSRPTETITSETDGMQLPFEEQSTWAPLQQGIVVDDLDPGFIVDQSDLDWDFRDLRRIGPFGWNQPVSLKVELDAGEPLYESRGQVIGRPGIWQRFDDLSAFGVYRKTLMSAEVRTQIQPARFVVSLPESSEWTLEYYNPFRSSNSSSGEADLRFLFEISDDYKSWDAGVTVNDMEHGWNFVGSFQLREGNVRVELLGTSAPGWIYADAIRWSKSERSNNEHPTARRPGWQE